MMKFLRENGSPEKAVLILDNASSHPSVVELKCKEVEVKYCPE